MTTYLRDGGGRGDRLVLFFHLINNRPHMFWGKRVIILPPTFQRWPEWWRLYDTCSSSPLWMGRIFHAARNQNSPLARPVNQQTTAVLYQRQYTPISVYWPFLDGPWWILQKKKMDRVRRWNHSPAGSYNLICSAFVLDITTSILWFF